MSFPGFNISKSTATTSTNNENTVSEQAVTHEKDLFNTSNSGSGSPFFGLLLKNPSSAGGDKLNSPSFKPLDPVTVTSVSQTVESVEADDQPHNLVSKAATASDLIGLFDKFDVRPHAEPIEPLASDLTFPDLNEKNGEFEDEVVNEKIEAIIDQLSSLHLKEMEQVQAKDVDNRDTKDDAKIEVKKVEEPTKETKESGLSDEESKEGRFSVENAFDDRVDPLESANSTTTRDDEDLDEQQRRRIENALLNLSDSEEEEELDAGQKKGDVEEHTEHHNLGLERKEDGNLIDLGDLPDKELKQADKLPENEKFKYESRLSSGQEHFDTTKVDNQEENIMPNQEFGQNSDESNGADHDHDSSTHLSHRPFDFQRFLSQLKHKSADPIVRYIRSFLVSFARQSPTFSTDQKIKIIRDFKIFMNEKFTLYEPFASMDDIDLENSREGIEKLIMNRLYNICFPPSTVKNEHHRLKSNDPDIISDQNFSSLVEKFSWVNGKHLDVDIVELSKKAESTSGSNKVDFIEYATAELNKINKYRAPRDKIICVLNLCKIIIGYLKTAKQETNADAFVPLLIMTILKAKTDNLISNIHYIENYRGEEWLNHGETGYYLSSLQGAIGFIENLGFEHLSIDKEEYDAHIEAWEAHQLQIEREREAALASADIQPVPLVQPSPTHIGTQGISLDTQYSLSPSSVLFNSAELVGKSISNFLSPSPQPSPSPQNTSLPQRRRRSEGRSQQQPVVVQDTPATQEALQTLEMMFPNLDRAVLLDLVHIKRGNVEECVDICLELVSET